MDDVDEQISSQLLQRLQQDEKRKLLLNEAPSPKREGNRMIPFGSKQTITVGIFLSFPRYTNMPLSVIICVVFDSQK